MCFPGYSYDKQFFLFIAFASIISAPPLRKILAAPLHDIEKRRIQSSRANANTSNYPTLHGVDIIHHLFSAS